MTVLQTLVVLVFLAFSKCNGLAGTSLIKRKQGRVGPVFGTTAHVQPVSTLFESRRAVFSKVLVAGVAASFLPRTVSARVPLTADEIKRIRKGYDGIEYAHVPVSLSL